jgi:hypothetical protein
MNPKTVYRLALVLTISQLRATRSGSRLDFLRRPSAILLMDAVAFVGAFLFTQRFASIITSQSPSSVFQLIANLPMFLIFLVMLSGLLWELSYSSSFTSTDMINYLPVSAGEYVLASSASIVFSYSVFLAVGLGIALALALLSGLVDVWAAVAVMSLVAMLIGAFGVEALRALTNRASSLLYKRSGKPVLILRMLILIVALASFQIVFNPRLMLFVLEGVTGGVKAAWYFPLVWPSLAVLSFLEADLTSAFFYAILTLAFATTLFLVSSRLRQIYWMPMPVSVRLSAMAYAPRVGLLNMLGLNPTEAAIVRKDFKSLTRRREMARILAVPVVIVVSMVIPSLMTADERPFLFSNVMFWAFPLLLGVLLFVLMNSMTSVGQEGHAVWNLYSSPISPKEFVKAKVSVNLTLSWPIALVFWLGITLLGHPSLRSSIAFLLVSTALIPVESLLGLIVGVRFPDFSETVRSRFVRLPSMLIGMLMGMFSAGVILAPYALYMFLKLPLMNTDMYFLFASFGSLTSMALISAIGYRMCLSQTKKFFTELPI